MREAKHTFTPGPWRAVVRSNQHGPQMVAVDMPPRGDWRATRARLTEEDVANARLIAAAPDLLAVVKSFVDETVDYATRNNLGDPEKQHNVKWARKIIAKAEGQS